MPFTTSLDVTEATVSDWPMLIGGTWRGLSPNSGIP